MIEKMEQLPDQLREALSSQGIYQHCISLVPDPGFVSADVRDWKAVFKNLHSNGLTSHQRSVWYMIMHKKIKHRELLFLRNVVDDPNCETCPGEPDTIVHKLFRCQQVRQVWRFQRRQIVIQEPSLAVCEPEDFVYPNFRHISRRSKRNIIQQLAKFYCYLLETPENMVDVDSFRFYVSIN